MGMIINGSRYTQSVVTFENEAIKIAIQNKMEYTQRTSTIITKSGDSFQKIASRILGDSTQYWKIAKLNPYITFPDAIPTGSVIRVPLS
jgi:nucleoid-associated protein YgaU